MKEQEDLDRELLKVEPTPSLPEVPSSEPAAAAAAKAKPKPVAVAAAADDDDDMAELAAWAS